MLAVFMVTRLESFESGIEVLGTLNLGHDAPNSVNFVTQFSTPNKVMPEGNKIWVLGDGVESNYAVSTHEVLVSDFTLKLMNVRKVNYTGSVVNNMGRLADLYHDL